jgi:hypothetical protein
LRRRDDRPGILGDGELWAVSRKPSALRALGKSLCSFIIVSTRLTIRCRPFGQSAIYNLQSEMPLCRALTSSEI